MYRTPCLTPLFLLLSLLLTLPAWAGWQTLPQRPADMYLHVTDSSGQRILGEIELAGIWLTHDGGTTWEPNSTRISSWGNVGFRSVYALDANADTLIAHATTGNIKSFNGGATWTTFPGRMEWVGGGFQIWQGRHDVWFYWGAGLYRSDDYAQSWDSLEGAATDMTVFYQDPAHDSSLFVMRMQWSPGSDTMGVIMRSTDLGHTWETVLDATSLYDCQMAFGQSMIRLSNGHLMAIVTARETGYNDIAHLLESADDGATWREHPAFPEGRSPHGIIEDPGVPGRVFITCKCRGGVMRSDNFGATWTDDLPGLPDIEIKAVREYQNPAGGAITVRVGNGGFYKSVDHGNSWQLVTMPAFGAMFNTMTVYPDAVYCYANEEDGRDVQWMLSSPYTAWQSIVSQVVAPDSTTRMGPILNRDGNTVIALAETRANGGEGGARSRMATSADDGMTWTFGPHLPYLLSRNEVNVFRSGNLVRFLTPGGLERDSVFYSEDLGQTWHVTAQLPGTHRNIEGFAQDENTIYVIRREAAQFGNFVYRSIDLGAHWNHIGPFGSDCRDIAVIGGELFACDPWNARIWHWAESGGEYRAMNCNPILNWVVRMACIPGTTPRLITISNPAGTLYITDDLGLNWVARQVEFPYESQNCVVWGLTVDMARGRLWANAGVGPCWLQLSELSGTSPLRFKPADFEVLKAYPNPFNASTHITYDLEKSGHVNVDLFDLEGRQVKTLMDGVQEAGRHEIRLDAGTLASGTYFVKLRSTAQTRTEKILLLK